MSDITSQTLTSLVKNIKEKKLSSEEVTKAFVDRSEKSKELNAYITEDFLNAIDKAKKFDEKPNLDLKLPIKNFALIDSPPQGVLFQEQWRAILGFSTVCSYHYQNHRPHTNYQSFEAPCICATQTQIPKQIK